MLKVEVLKALLRFSEDNLMAWNGWLEAFVIEHKNGKRADVCLEATEQWNI